MEDSFKLKRILSLKLLFRYCWSTKLMELDHCLNSKFISIWSSSLIKSKVASGRAKHEIIARLVKNVTKMIINKFLISFLNKNLVPPPEQKCFVSPSPPPLKKSCIRPWLNYVKESKFVSRIRSNIQHINHELWRKLKIEWRWESKK